MQSQLSSTSSLTQQPSGNIVYDATLQSGSILFPVLSSSLLGNLVHVKTLQSIKFPYCIELCSGNMEAVAENHSKEYVIYSRAI